MLYDAMCCSPMKQYLILLLVRSFLPYFFLHRCNQSVVPVLRTLIFDRQSILYLSSILCLRGMLTGFLILHCGISCMHLWSFKYYQSIFSNHWIQWQICVVFKGAGLRSQRTANWFSGSALYSLKIMHCVPLAKKPHKTTNQQQKNQPQNQIKL